MCMSSEVYNPLILISFSRTGTVTVGRDMDTLSNRCDQKEKLIHDFTFHSLDHCITLPNALPDSFFPNQSAAIFPRFNNLSVHVPSYPGL